MWRHPIPVAWALRRGADQRGRRVVALAGVLLALDGCGVTADEGAPADVTIAAPDLGKADGFGPGAAWFEQASALADRRWLGQAFASGGYAPPTGTYLLAARVVDGVEQPAFELYSLEDTGFAYSADRYWPASTVKVLAAVGALATLAQHGLTGDAVVSFRNDDGAYAGPVSALYDAAIVVSDNEAYNRLMEIAGFDEMNDHFLTAEAGFPQAVLQRRFTHPTATSDLRTSPTIAYEQDERTGTLPERVGTGQHPECPREGNCLTLFELLDGLRRVALHEELPAHHRFDLDPVDVARLQQALLDAPSRMAPGAEQAVGHAVIVYNKTGSVAGDDRLDHGLIVDPASDHRWLVALSMPYDATSDAMAAELTRQTLLALEQAAGRVAPLQADAGVAIQAAVVPSGIALTTEAERTTAWFDGVPAPMEGSVVQLPGEPGRHWLTVQAFAGGQRVGHRSFVVTVP